MEVYYNNDVLTVIEEKADTLNAWLRDSFIEPSVKKAKGPGTRNIFNRNDLFNIMLFKVLAKTTSDRREASNVVKGALIYWDKMEEDGGDFQLSIVKKYIDSTQEARLSISPVVKRSSDNFDHGVIAKKFDEGFNVAIVVNLTAIIKKVSSKL